MRRHATRAAKWAGVGIFKGAALVAAFALIVAVWFQDAALLAEAVLLAKLVMIAAGYPFVLAGRGISARWRWTRTSPGPGMIVTDRRL